MQTPFKSTQNNLVIQISFKSTQLRDGLIRNAQFTLFATFGYICINNREMPKYSSLLH